MTSAVGVQNPQGRNLGTCGLEILLKRRTQLNLTLMSFPESTARVLEGSQAPGLLTHHHRHPPKQGGAEHLLSQPCGNSEPPLPRQTNLVGPNPHIHAHKGLYLPAQSRPAGQM